MKELLLHFILICLAVSVGAQNKVLIPPVLNGENFDLTLQNGSVSFYAGNETKTLGVNGAILGPTLILEAGKSVQINVHNTLNETTTIHWHGMHVSAANDGGPHTTIAPGETWSPAFTVLDKAATYWYHPHLHENTNRHVSLGIAGFVLVKDKEEAALTLPRTYGTDDFPLVVQTKDFDTDNQIIVPSNNDDVVMVNATINPELEVPAQMVRLRLLNGASNRVFNFGFGNNKTFYQIASDGGLLEAPVSLSRLMLAPGERAEILVDFSTLENQQIKLRSFASELSSGMYGATNPGMSLMMTLDGYNPNPLNGADFDILTLKVKAPTEKAVFTLPEKLITSEKIDVNKMDTNRSLVFSPAQMGANQLNGNFLINGLTFNMDVINFSIPLNNTEIWTITNQSGIAHPFHIHDVQFYILDRNGQLPPLNERGRKDVVLVQPMETVRFITEFKDFANDPVPYMLHCHMLTHEDLGMMLQFEVVDKTTSSQQIKTEMRDIRVYPNPVSKSQIITVSGLKSNTISYRLVNLLGQVYLASHTEINQNKVTIDIASVKPGDYILAITEDTKTTFRKIIVL